MAREWRWKAPWLEPGLHCERWNTVGCQRRSAEPKSGRRPLPCLGYLPGTLPFLKSRVAKPDIRRKFPQLARRTRRRQVTRLSPVPFFAGARANPSQRSCAIPPPTARCPVSLFIVPLIPPPFLLLLSPYNSVFFPRSPEANNLGVVGEEEVGIEVGSYGRGSGCRSNFSIAIFSKEHL